MKYEQRWHAAQRKKEAKPLGLKRDRHIPFVHSDGTAGRLKSSNGPSDLGSPIGCRPTRPLVEYRGSITAIKRAHGTTRCVTARNFRATSASSSSRSALAKLRWFISMVL
jgi:hypothetical protein